MMEEDEQLKILTHIYAIVCSIGLCGNILSLIVYSRKKFQNTIFSTYFRLLSLFDFLTLLIRFDYILNEYDCINIRAFSIFICKLIYYFVYIQPSISSWILSTRFRLF